MALHSDRPESSAGLRQSAAGFGERLAGTGRGLLSRVGPGSRLFRAIAGVGARADLATRRVIGRALDSALADRVNDWLERAQAPLHAAGRWIAGTAPARMISGTIARRIFVANLLGLFVLLGGILWLSQQQEWLIAAKRDSLRVQGDIIAAAIAANVSLDTDRLTLDADKLTEIGGSRAPFRDDAFAAFDLSLKPDRVGPVLRRLMLNANNTRARLYDREGELLVDTQRAVPERIPPRSADEPARKVRVKTFWTRVTDLFDSSELTVYREIGGANGTYYPEVRSALKGETPEPMLLLNSQNKKIVSLAVPIQRRNQTLGVLLLSTRPGDIDKVLAKERRIIFSLAAMALLTTLMASLMLNRTIAGPVRRLSAAAERVSQSINARAELPDYSDRRDEVGQLAGAFKRMTMSLFRRIEASEKFAADVAHELKNPLTAARSTAETMAYARTEEEREELVRRIKDELARLNRLISDVSNASRLEAELARRKNAPVDIRAVLTGVVEVLRDINQIEGLSITVDIADENGRRPLVILGHEGRLGQVVTNLLDNAVSFSKEGGEVNVKARHIGGEIEILVEDTGPGMPEDKLEAIFERFYSDRPETDHKRGKNSGLGLSISREIVNAHGGRIWAENRPPRTGKMRPGGARFVVRLPATAGTTGRGASALGRR